MRDLYEGVVDPAWTPSIPDYLLRVEQALVYLDNGIAFLVKLNEVLLHLLFQLFEVFSSILFRISIYLFEALLLNAFVLV